MIPDTLFNDGFCHGNRYNLHGMPVNVFCMPFNDKCHVMRPGTGLN